MITVRPVAHRNRRKASELARIGRCQQITETAYRLDYIDAELLANAPDEYLDRVGVPVEVLIIEMLDQLGARDHAAGVMHEIGEQPVFVRGELDRIAVDGDAAAARIEPHCSAHELALSMPGRAAQQRADARQYLLQVKGLGHVVVGADVETPDLVAPAVARGEDQHRHGAAAAAPRLEYRDAVHLGQPDIEDDGVIRLAFAEIVALLAVEGAIDHIAGVGERRRQLPIEIRIVLDHEEAHGNFSYRSPTTAPLVASTISRFTLPSRANSVST